MKTKLSLILASFIVMAVTTKGQVNSGYDVIRLMKETNKKSHLTNFTFSQYITQFKNDTVIHKTVWHEAYTAPNQLIIKFDNFESGNGYVFNNDSMHVMKGNKIEKKTKYIHDLLVLGFDVYEQEVQLTFDKLTEAGYDLSQVCETKMNEIDAYCVGVEKETEKRNKFYIDKENLCFLKMVSFSHSLYDMAEFKDYKPVNDKYIATKVLFYNNGKLIMTEEYFDIDFPESLNKDIFNPENFKDAKW